MNTLLQTERATLWHARAEEVYPLIDPGSCSMAWVDGPYAMRKAPWDMMNVDDLPAFYAPHYEALDRVLAPSATVYHWGTAEGWARVDPVIRGMGWTFRGLITWDKGMASLAGRIDTEALQTWPDTTEVCGFYQREGLAAPNLAFEAGADPRNVVRFWLNAERERAGIPLSRLKQLVDDAGGCGEMICRHSFYESQWLMPTYEQWAVLHRVWNLHGEPTGRPYLQQDRSVAAACIADLQDEKRVLRIEYEAMRVPFSLPVGVSNVWKHPQVSGKERIQTVDGETHPCQKPLAFADRAIRASTRPGDTIIDPFSGTNRCALACHRLPAEEARHAHGIEMDARWLDAIRPSLVADYAHVPKGQAALFVSAGASP